MADEGRHVLSRDMLQGDRVSLPRCPHGLGDGRRGQRLVGDKGCLSCHAVYGRGANSAPDLATSNVVSSVDGQLAALWNHGRLMSTLSRRQTVPIQELTGQELADIATYLAAVGKGPSRPR
jgi:mono/diheme cytochrome c family protein